MWSSHEESESSDVELHNHPRRRSKANYGWFDAEAQCSDTSSCSTSYSQDLDEYDLHDPFIDDEIRYESDSSTSSYLSAHHVTTHDGSCSGPISPVLGDECSPEHGHASEPGQSPRHRHSRAPARRVEGRRLSELSVGDRDDIAISDILSHPRLLPHRPRLRRMDVDQQHAASSTDSTTGSTSNARVTDSEDEVDTIIVEEDSQSSQQSDASAPPSPPASDRSRPTGKRPRAVGPDDSAPGPKRARTRKRPVPTSSPSLVAVDSSTATSTSGTDVESSNRKFRFDAKNIFLTYPKCPLDKHLVGAYLRDKLSTVSNPVVRLVVAQEQHLNGEYHLHAVIQMKKQRTVYDCRFLDIPRYLGQPPTSSTTTAPTESSSDTYHPHIDIPSRVNSAISYICKDDSSPYMFGISMAEVRPYRNGTSRPQARAVNGEHTSSSMDITLPKASSAKPKLSDTIATQLLGGKSLQDVLKEHPGYVMQNLSKLEKFLASLVTPITDAARLKSPDLDRLTSIHHKDDSSINAIVDWLRTNMRQARQLRQKQLYIHGPPGVGKTRLSQFLREYYLVYDIPRREDFYDLYHDMVDVAILDEFTGSMKSIQWLNSFLDGSNFTLPKKGAQYEKRRNIPVIILSNYSPEDNYPRADRVALRALMDRLLVVSLSEGVTLELSMPELSTVSPVEEPTPTSGSPIASMDTNLCPSPPSTQDNTAFDMMMQAQRQIHESQVAATATDAPPVITYTNLMDDPYILSRYRAGKQPATDQSLEE